MISKSEFANRAPKGTFLAPNSLGFSDSDSGNFYKWSWQMFLSLSESNKNGLVFESSPYWNYNQRTGEFLKDPAMGERDRKPEDIEEFNEADNRVLLNQGNSLVYFGQHAIDVLRRSAKGHVVGALKDYQFPTNKQQVANLVAYLKSEGVKFNPQDLLSVAIEMKNSWVEIDPTSPKSKRYPTIPTTVPVYTKASDHGAPDGKTRLRHRPLLFVLIHGGV